jgi:hypothetical protein
MLAHSGSFRNRKLIAVVGLSLVLRKRSAQEFNLDSGKHS